MTYNEAKEAIVTAQEAMQEIKLHYLDFNDFIKEVGEKEEYKGIEVLDWLGY